MTLPQLVKHRLKNYAADFRPVSLLWLLLPFTLSPLSFAHAYLDPGAGSYAIQIAIGFIFGASYAFKGFFAKVTRHWHKPKDKEQPKSL